LKGFDVEQAYFTDSLYRVDGDHDRNFDLANDLYHELSCHNHGHAADYHNGYLLAAYNDYFHAARIDEHSYSNSD
jgi:hypothetical protein